jgi:hypothetical protein
MDVENTDLERLVLAHERFYRFSLPIWQKRNQNFWSGYNRYLRNTTHWAPTSRIILIRPHTHSSSSSKWCA